MEAPIHVTERRGGGRVRYGVSPRVAGTGPAVGVFLAIGVVSLAIASLAWTVGRPTGRTTAAVTGHWRMVMTVGGSLLAAAIALVNVAQRTGHELPEAGWFLLMLTLVTSVGLLTVGLTVGLTAGMARRLGGPPAE